VATSPSRKSPVVMNAREVVAGHALGSPDGYQNKGLRKSNSDECETKGFRENGSCDEYLTRWVKRLWSEEKTMQNEEQVLIARQRWAGAACCACCWRLHFCITRSGGILVEQRAVGKPFAEFPGDGCVVGAAAIQAKRKI